MSDQNNKLIPVIIGMVGGAEEYESLKPVFAEFHLTFGACTPIKIIQASMFDGVSLFDEHKPSSQVKLELLPTSDKEGIAAQDIAAYLLRNCHFVLLAKTLEAKDPIRAAVQAFVSEIPANTHPSDTAHLSIFDLPEPCPILSQTEKNSLKLEIIKDKVTAREGEHKNYGKVIPYTLPLFEYEPRLRWYRRVWSGLTGNPPSPFHATSKERPILSSGNPEDLLDKRWLVCLEGIHRQAEFNENSIQVEPDVYQAARFGYNNVEKIPDTIQPIFQIFFKADKLASHYQTRWQQLRFTTVKNLDPKSKKENYSLRFVSFFWMAALSAFLLAFSTEFGDLFDGWANPVSSILYIGILIWSMKRYYVARVERWEQKHQDYRFIAEVLAVQIYWVQAGIKSFASSHFPSGVRNEVQWVRRAVHSARLVCKQVGVLTSEGVAKSWIEDENNGQLRYHEETLHKRREGALHALKTKRSRWGYAFIFLFCVLMMLTGIKASNLVAECFNHSPDAQQYMTQEQNKLTILEGSVTHSKEAGGHDSEWWMEQGHHAVIVSMALSLVIFALFGEAIEGYALEQELTRSEELVTVYKRCLKEFERQSIGEREKRELLAEVGIFAIEAEANWLIVHRERPMQPVKGG